MLDRVFAEHGFSLNYKSGKTEFLCVFRGPKAVAAKQQLMVAGTGRIAFKGHNGATQELACVQAYRHVGTRQTVGGTLMPEIRQRMATMSDTSHKMAPTIKSDAIDSKHKYIIVKSMLLSKGLFQAGAWPVLQTSELSKVHAGVMRLYRKIDGSDGPLTPWRNDDAIVEQHSLAAPRVLLTVLRLLLFARVLAKGSKALLVVLASAVKAKRSWLGSVHMDLK